MIFTVRNFAPKLSWRTTFCIGEVRGIRCWSCPANELKLRTKNYKLTKRSIGEVQPQTEADSELQLKLDCLAPFFAYALLAAGVLLPLISVFIDYLIFYNYSGHTGLQFLFARLQDESILFESCLLHLVQLIFQV